MPSRTQQPDPMRPAAPLSQDDAQREFALTLSGFSAVDKPEYDDYSRCVHCGLCANNCPTYRLWGQEADSPRGRIRQMALVDQGRLELGAAFVTHIDRCLNCRNCETVCPSGVEYGKILELARAQIEQKYKRPFVSRVLRDVVYRRLLPYPGRIAAAARGLKIYQRSGLAALARGTGILRLLGLQDREKLLPRIDSEFFFGELGKTFPARGERRARVAFFAGCVAQVTFSELNRATIRVLQANGCEVVVPAGQVCCGALAAHAGVRDVARDLARRNFDAFSGRGVRRDYYQRGWVRVYAEGIHAFIWGRRCRAGARAAIHREDAGRNGISGGSWNDCAAAGFALARDLSGFVPFGAWTKDSRGSERIAARNSRTRIRGDAAFGTVLRVGGSLQRYRDRNIVGDSGTQDGVRGANEGRGDCDRESWMHFATAGWGGYAQDGTGSVARGGIAGSSFGLTPNVFLTFRFRVAPSRE